MAKNLSKIAVLSLTSVLLAACESMGGGSNLKPIATEPDLVTVRIAQASEKASKALDTIAGIEQQRAPAQPPIEDYSLAPSALTQPITIKWSGPIESITRMLAGRAGMQFKTKGSAPPVPLTVNLDVYQQPLVEVLRDIGMQAGQRADLAVESQKGIVEIRYASVDKY